MLEHQDSCAPEQTGQLARVVLRLSARLHTVNTENGREVKQQVQKRVHGNPLLQRDDTEFKDLPVQLLILLFRLAAVTAPNSSIMVVVIVLAIRLAIGVSRAGPRRTQTQTNIDPAVAVITMIDAAIVKQPHDLAQSVPLVVIKADTVLLPRLLAALPVRRHAVAEISLPVHPVPLHRSRLLLDLKRPTAGAAFDHPTPFLVLGSQLPGRPLQSESQPLVRYRVVVDKMIAVAAARSVLLGHDG
ncbi:hypothetical protein DL768_006396 [Monosporascus sp. mg162]|nr:hypothetical protein DL768_006396 [Monosporascus sp. mg162]